MKAARRPQKRPRAYRMTGYYRAKAALSRAGIAALDGRTREGRAIASWRADIAADLGGEAEMSRAERTLLDAAAGDLALLALADTWLLAHGDEVINRRRRAFVPLVQERLRVASDLAELLKVLGTKRRAKPVPTLAEIIAEHDAHEAAAGAALDAPGTDRRPTALK